MKKIFVYLAVIMLTAAYLPTASAQDLGQTIPTVSVNGSAQLKVTPDEIYIAIKLDETDTKGKVTLDEQRKDMFSALKKCGIDIEKQLREIARDKRYWEQKREKIRQTDRKVEELEQSYQEQLAAIREQRRVILHEAKTRAKELIAEANRQIEGTIRGIREAQAEREQTRSLRQSFNEFKDSVESVDSADNNAQIDREMERIARRRQRREERKANKSEQAPQTEIEKKKLPVEVGSKVYTALFKPEGVVCHTFLSPEFTIACAVHFIKPEI